MRLEVAADGILIRVDRKRIDDAPIGTAPPPEYIVKEEFAITLDEAEALVRGLPQAIEQLKDKAQERRAYEIRQLRSKLNQLEGTPS